MPVHAQITGVLHRVMEANISSTGFEKRIFHVKEKGNRSIWQLEAHQGMSNEVVKYLPGQEVSCQIEVQGREWEREGKVIVTNTLRCWKIEAANPEIDAAVRNAEAGIAAIVK